jgi:hypothetical protein
MSEQPSTSTSTPSPPQAQNGADRVSLDLESRKLAKLQVVGVQLGGAVSRSIAANALSNAALASIQNIGTTAATTAMVSRAQMQSLGLIALRLPLAQGSRLHQFTTTVAEFTATHTNCLAEIATMTKTQQLIQVGVQGNIISVLAAAAVQEAIAVAYLYRGWSTPDEFKDNSIAIALAGVGSLAGGVAGAGVGTLIVPGAGTVMGSLLGSFGGAFVPQAVKSRWEQRSSDDGSLPPPYLRPLRCVERNGQGYSDWLEIVDCSESALSTKSYFLVDGVPVPSTAAALEADEENSVTVVHSSLRLSSEEGKTDETAEDIPVADTDVILLLRVTEEDA